MSCPGYYIGVVTVGSCGIVGVQGGTADTLLNGWYDYRCWVAIVSAPTSEIEEHCDGLCAGKPVCGTGTDVKLVCLSGVDGCYQCSVEHDLAVVIGGGHTDGIRYVALLRHEDELLSPVVDGDGLFEKVVAAADAIVGDACDACPLEDCNRFSIGGNDFGAGEGVSGIRKKLEIVACVESDVEGLSCSVVAVGGCGGDLYLGVVLGGHNANLGAGGRILTAKTGPGIVLHDIVRPQRASG